MKLLIILNFLILAGFSIPTANYDLIGKWVSTKDNKYHLTIGNKAIVERHLDTKQADTFSYTIGTRPCGSVDGVSSDSSFFRKVNNHGSEFCYKLTVYNPDSISLTYSVDQSKNTFKRLSKY